MKTPKAKKLPSGNWRTQVMVGGSAVSITAPTRKESEQKALELKAKHAGGASFTAPSGMALGEAIDRYIEARDKVLSPSTLRGYGIIRRNRFKEVMGARMRDIKNWQAVVNAESAGCSEKTLKNAWGLVSSVLKENGIDPGNVRLPSVPPKERPFLQPEEIKAFMAAARGHRYELPWLLCLHGLRFSEVAALEKQDVTKDGICVRKAMVAGPDNRMRTKQKTKNASSTRTVPIMADRVLELLDRYPDGRMMCHAQERMNEQLKKLCSDNGLTAVTLHGLRHSFASLCYHLGIPELQCMEFGGWADLNVMRRIYTHVAEADRRKAAGAVRGFLDG